MTSSEPKLEVHVQDQDEPQDVKPHIVTPLGYTVNHDMRESPDTCSLTIDPRDGRRFSRSGMQLIRVFFNNGRTTTQRFVGRTDGRTGGCDASGRNLTVAARDMSLHLTDCDAPIGSVKNQSLKTFAERCVGQFGVGDDGEFSFVLTDSIAETYKMAGKRRGRRAKLPAVNATTLNKNDWRVQPNTSCWQAITKFALQVGIVPWMRDQALCLTRPNYEADPKIYGSGLITDRRGGGNTLSADLRLTSQNRFAAYKGKCQVNVQGPKKEITVGGETKKVASMKTVNRVAAAVDPSPAFWIRTTEAQQRVGADPLIAKFGAQSGTNLADRHARARWIRGNWYGDEALMKRAIRAEMERNAIDGWEYTVTVEGLAAENGAYWTTDTMVNVLDTTQDGYLIDKPMYIVAVEESLSSGADKPVTTLTLIPPKVWLYYEYTDDTKYINAIKEYIDY